MAAIARMFDGGIALATLLDDRGEIIDLAISKVAGSSPRMLGVDPAACGHKRLSELLTGHCRERFFETCRAVLATGHPAEAELRIASTGTWIECRMIPVSDGIILGCRDITERKREAEALRQSEARFRSLVQNSSDFMLVVRPDRTLQYASPSVQRLLGYAAAECLGRPVLQFIHPDDRAAVEERIERLLAGQALDGAAEYRVLHRNGCWVWFESIATNMLDDPAVRGLVVNARDVTARKEAEAASRQSDERLRLALDAAGMAMWDWNLTTNQFVRSEQMTTLFGLPAGSLDDPSIDVVDRVHPDDRHLVHEMDRRHIEEGEPYDVTYRVPFPDGSIRWLRERGHAHYDEGRNVRRLLGVTSDVTELKRTEEQLRQAERQFRTLVEQIPAVTYVATSIEGSSALKKHYVSPQIEGLLGYSPEEWIADPELFLSRVHPDDRPRVDAANERAFAQGEYRCEVRLRRRDGGEIWVRERAARVAAGHGDTELWQGVLFDVTEEKRAEEVLRFQSELLHQVQAGVIGTDRFGVISHWNRFAETLYGWTGEEAIGRHFTALLAPDGVSDGLAADLLRTTDEGSGFGEFSARRKDGTLVPVHFSTAPVVDGQERTIGFVSVSVDLSERKEMEERLASIAYRDPVTGLANRALLLERLHEALDAATDGTQVALLFLDLDRFKVVNDSLGHDAGDRLLLQVGERLAECLRPSDLIARFGGDEFAILCHGQIGTDQAAAIAGRLLSALVQPFEIDGRPAFINGSLGIALSGGRNIDAGELTREADIAMYEAKAGGRGQYRVFDERASTRVIQRLAHETDLRRAVERGEFEVHYQPVVDLADGTIHAFEALLRWRHPTRGLLLPGEFLGLACETGLIEPIGEWVLGEATKQANAWRMLRPLDPPKVAVNIGPPQLRGSGFARTLEHVLRETGLPPSLLMLEVTEDALAEDSDAAEALLQTIRALGVRIALDDFGTGYSSLSRLQRLPLDTVKIDRSFAAGLGSDAASEAIVRAVAALAGDLGLTVVAEGIETEEQGQVAAALGCHRGQGYYFSWPLPADDIVELMRCRDGIMTNADAA